MDERNDYNSIPMQPIQTAVDWLIEQLIPKDQHEGIIDIIEEAKQMEKEQIKAAWIATDNQLQRMAAENYYNKTYEKNTNGTSIS